MYYIRILTSPKLTVAVNNQYRKNAPATIVTKITIATDLGESFLGQNVRLSATLLTASPAEQICSPIFEYLWKGEEGMRALEIRIPLSTPKPKSGQTQRVQIWIRPAETHVSIESFGAFLEGSSGVLSVRSGWIDLGNGNTAATNVDLMERLLVTGDGRKVHIWEEIGESIARHIWDAGLVLAAWIAETLCPMTNGGSSILKANLPELPSFAHLLRALGNKPNTRNHQPIQVLELGAGCGVVSLTLLSCLKTSPSATRLTLTDLSTATAIITTNINAYTSEYPQPLNRPPIATYTVLDWNADLPSSISATAWDVVLVADCTYNPDVVPDLVATLGRIRNQSHTLEAAFERPPGDSNKGTMVIVALKERHAAERVFFSLMTRNQWVILEQCIVPLPMAVGPEEEIQIFVFV